MKFQNGDKVLAGGQLASIVAINYESGIVTYRIVTAGGGKNDVTTDISLVTLSEVPGEAYEGRGEVVPETEPQEPFGLPGDEFVSTETQLQAEPVKRGPGRPRKDQS